MGTEGGSGRPLLLLDVDGPLNPFDGMPDFGEVRTGPFPPVTAMGFPGRVRAARMAIMTDRRPLAMPAFSEPSSDSPLPARSGGHRPLPIEQGADFRQPPGEVEAVPAPARHRLSLGGLTFSDPDRQI